MALSDYDPVSGELISGLPQDTSGEGVFGYDQGVDLNEFFRFDQF